MRDGREYVLVALEHFSRRWVCTVVRSGFHNGAGCTSTIPHNREFWGCGYVTEVGFSDRGFDQLARMMVRTGDQ